MLLAYLVSVPGASDFYIGGKLVYSVKQRLRLSGWSDSEIAAYVGPLEHVALKLARTTRYELGSTYVLSETGFAGPSTDLHLAHPNSPVDVGTVYLGLSGSQYETCCTRQTGSSDRLTNMAEFARMGLQFFLDQLHSNS